MGPYFHQKHCILERSRDAKEHNMQLISKHKKNPENGMLHRKCNTCFNAPFTLPWVWYNMQFTRYNGQFLIWRWNHTQRAMGYHSTLMNDVVPCEEFIDDVTRKIWITFHSHSFVARHSVQVLTQCKEIWNDHECVVLLDFTQNSSLTAQDAVQVYHWSMVKQHFILH
jgi:hypothetical protein